MCSEIFASGGLAAFIMPRRRTLRRVCICWRKTPLSGPTSAEMPGCVPSTVIQHGCSRKKMRSPACRASVRESLRISICRAGSISPSVPGFVVLSRLIRPCLPRRITDSRTTCGNCTVEQSLSPHGRHWSSGFALGDEMSGFDSQSPYNDGHGSTCLQCT